MPKLRELGVGAVIYSSYDYGFGGDRSGYAVLCGNRSWLPKEHKKVWNAVDYLLGGGFDEREQRQSDSPPGP